MDKNNKSAKAKISPPTAADATRQKAQEAWVQHKKSERQNLLKLGLIGLASLGAMAGAYYAFQPKVLPLTPQQKMDEAARLARENPEGALAGRVAPGPRDPSQPAPKVAPPSKQVAAPHAGVSMAAPQKKPAPAMIVAPLTAPTQQMLDDYSKANGGKRPLAVDVDGYAKLPSGERVKVTPTAKAPPLANQPNGSVSDMAKARQAQLDALVSSHREPIVNHGYTTHIVSKVDSEGNIVLPNGEKFKLTPKSSPMPQSAQTPAKTPAVGITPTPIPSQQQPVTPKP